MYCVRYGGLDQMKQSSILAAATRESAAVVQRVEIAGSVFEVTFRFPADMSHEQGLRAVIARQPLGPHEVRRCVGPGLRGLFARRRVPHGSLMWHRAVFAAAQAALAAYGSDTR
jgi:hypothetical protein